jgi:hypothetical protein
MLTYCCILEYPDPDKDSNRVGIPESVSHTYRIVD